MENPQNAVADLVNRLATRDAEIARLRAALSIAEMNSAARLGVPPVDFSHLTGNVSRDVAAVYAGLVGEERLAYYKKHSEALWKRATGATVAE
jgi:hypothetical protein